MLFNKTKFKSIRLWNTTNTLNNKIYFNNTKTKIKFYTISNIYYNKIYKTIKIFSSFIHDYTIIRFNIIKIKTILFNKQSKEYVVILKNLNLNNILHFFYK
uniref:Uncharacterized protein n=2 Tax=Babesia TaxID=5864 RepID=A0A411ADA4_9APIC|nr:hypothetical protein BLAP_27 [Babesia sp. Lintan]QAX27050.1 hypothetical protein [Babesia motasi]